MILVAAFDQQFGMGYRGGLPWPKFTQDMEHFRRLTMGGTLVLGGATMRSIGRVLPGRKMIVISRHEDTTEHKDLTSVKNPADVLVQPGMFYIGGPAHYEFFWPHIKEVYLTFIDKVFDADVVFPTWLFNAVNGPAWSNEIKQSGFTGDFSYRIIRYVRG